MHQLQAKEKAKPFPAPPPDHISADAALIPISNQRCHQGGED
jgi:hypothetical protein